MNNKIDEKPLVIFCSRLRKLRRQLNFNIEEVCEKTGLTYSQIQRIEADIREKDGKIIKKGSEGRMLVLYALLNFYSKYVSLDYLFNLNMPIEKIPSINPSAKKEIIKAELDSIIGDINKISTYFE